MPKVIVDDGIEINYYVDDFTNPWAEGRDTIVMLPALGETAKYLIPITPAMARNYRVIRMDPRGRGESSAPPEGSPLSGKPDGEASLAERCAMDARCLIDSLGTEKIHWVGAGGGGVVGIHFAVSYPNRIKSLTMIGSPSKLPENVLAGWRLGEEDVPTTIRKMGFNKWLDRTLPGNDLSDSDPKMMAWNWAERKKQPQHVMVSYNAWAEKFDVSGLLPKIKVPTLILAAGKAVDATKEDSQFIKQQIPNSKLIVFDIGPKLHLNIPDKCTEAILNFLKNIV